MRSYLIAAILMTSVLSGIGIAHAGTVTYTGQITATGTLGTSSFNDALVTITEIADTSTITLQSPGVPGIYANVATEATVTIAGIGTATFTDPLGITAATAANNIGVVPSLLMTDLAPLVNVAIFSLNPASPEPTLATLSTDGSTTGPILGIGPVGPNFATDRAHSPSRRRPGTGKSLWRPSQNLARSSRRASGLAW